MTDILPKPGSYRTTQQISDSQIKLGMTVDRILREIESAQNKIVATKQEVANRWKTVAGIAPADRSRIAQREAATRTREIVKDTIVKLEDAYRTAEELYEEIKLSEVFYPGKLQFLMNATIMSEKRAQYAAALSLAGPVELAGYASYAVGVQDVVMAAAVIQANDALPAKERRFLSVAVSERIDISAWNSVQATFKRAEILWNQAEIAVRTFKSGKSSPVDTIRLAMLKSDSGS